MRRALFTFILLGLFVPPIQAAPKKNKDRDANVVFQPGERRVITDYFRDTRRLPPGLTKRGGNLPPGLEKQLRRNGQLPPGLQKRFEPFPVDLNQQLPRLPGIYRRGILGDRAVIYNPTTMRIVDMINLFTGLRF